MIIDARPNMIKDVSPQYAEQWVRDREYELSQEQGQAQ